MAPIIKTTVASWSASTGRGLCKNVMPKVMTYQILPSNARPTSAITSGAIGLAACVVWLESPGGPDRHRYPYYLYQGCVDRCVDQHGDQVCLCGL
jgi:hypothetical protein